MAKSTQQRGVRENKKKIDIIKKNQTKKMEPKKKNDTFFFFKKKQSHATTPFIIIFIIIITLFNHADILPLAFNRHRQAPTRCSRNHTNRCQNHCRSPSRGCTGRYRASYRRSPLRMWGKCLIIIFFLKGRERKQTWEKKKKMNK